MVNSGVKLSKKALSLQEEFAKEKKGGFKMVIAKPEGSKNSEVVVIDESILDKDDEKPLHKLFLEANLEENSPW